MRRLLFTLCVLAWPALASAQVVFDMDYGAGADPTAGWDEAETPDANWSRTRVAGGGASGQDIYRLTQTYNGAGNGGQFSWGWRGLDTCTISAGSHCYYRFRYRFTASTNYQCRDWETGSDGANCINKLFMENEDSCTPGSCRFILSVESDRSAGNYYFRLQKDGGDDLVDTPTYQEGDWKDVQIDLQFSSSTGATDGAYRIWVDTNTQGSPTAARTGIVLNVGSNPSETRFGGFMNHGIESGGVYVYEVADFEIGSSFDSAWDGGGGGGAAVVVGGGARFRVR